MEKPRIGAITDLWVTKVCVPDPGLCTGLITFYLYSIQCFEQTKRGSQNAYARSLIQVVKVCWGGCIVVIFLSLATYIQRQRESLIESCVAYLLCKSQNSQERNAPKILIHKVLSHSVIYDSL